MSNSTVDVARAGGTARRTAADRLAKLLTDLLSPGVLVVIVVVCQAWRSAANPTQAWVSAILGIVTGSAIPIAYIVAGVRRGRWTDHHVRVRDQRRWPLAVALTSGTIGTILLGLIGARAVMALGAAGMAALVIAMVVTFALKWKVSIHAAAAAAVAAVLTVMFGPWLALTWPVTAAIGWSRVRLGDHTVGQVLAGSAIGAVVTGSVYLLLR
jgi:hypothetical protein